MTHQDAVIYLLARIFTCAVWFGTGLYKIFHYRMTIAEMAEHQVPWPSFSLPVVIGLEVIGSILVIANVYVWLVCLAWIVYLFPATYFYHRQVLTPQGWINFPQYMMALKNASLLGGLLVMMLMDAARPVWLLRW